MTDETRTHSVWLVLWHHKNDTSDDEVDPSWEQATVRCSKADAVAISDAAWLAAKAETEQRGVAWR